MRNCVICIILSTLIGAAVYATAAYAAGKTHEQRLDELQIHVDFFKKLMGVDEITTIIHFQRMPTVSNPAACILSHRVIIIDPLVWDHYDKYEQENIVLHELGHCELYYAHSGGIMYESVLPSHVYRRHRDQLLQMYKQGLPLIGGGL